jgi:hypothetical protein
MPTERERGWKKRRPTHFRAKEIKEISPASKRPVVADTSANQQFEIGACSCSTFGKGNHRSTRVNDCFKAGFSGSSVDLFS